MKPLPQIARELNVDGILEGTVLRSGTKVRITAELINAQTDEHIWAESYGRDLQNVLNLQRELARQISREIKVTVEPPEQRQLATPTTVNPQDHELYLKGRYFWNRRNREAFGARNVEFANIPFRKRPNVTARKRSKDKPPTQPDWPLPSERHHVARHACSSRLFEPQIAPAELLRKGQHRYQLINVFPCRERPS